MCIRDRADTDDDCACGGLDHAGDEGAENDTLDGGGGQLLQHALHPVSYTHLSCGRSAFWSVSDHCEK